MISVYKYDKIYNDYDLLVKNGNTNDKVRNFLNDKIENKSGSEDLYFIEQKSNIT